jgi:hypothetical protein
MSSRHSDGAGREQRVSEEQRPPAPDQVAESAPRGRSRRGPDDRRADYDALDPVQPGQPKEATSLQASSPLMQVQTPCSIQIPTPQDWTEISL